MPGHPHIDALLTSLGLQHPAPGCPDTGTPPCLTLDHPSVRTSTAGLPSQKATSATQALNPWPRWPSHPTYQRCPPVQTPSSPGTPPGSLVSPAVFFSNPPHLPSLYVLDSVLDLFFLFSYSLDDLIQFHSFQYHLLACAGNFHIHSSSLHFSPETETHVSNCLLFLSNLVDNGHLTLNIFKTEMFIPFCLTSFFSWSFLSEQEIT